MVGIRTAFNGKFRQLSMLLKLRIDLSDRTSTSGGMFEVAFGRPPSEEERRLMSGLEQQGSPTPIESLRFALAVVDQYHSPTSLAVRFGPNDIEYLNIGGVSLCIDKADYAIGLHLKHVQDYEPHLVSFLRKVLCPGMRIVDMGANIGFYSMLFAGAVGPEGYVYAFEPRSENCRLFLLSAARNGFHNIRLHPLALSSPGTNYLALVPAIGTNASTRDVGDLENSQTMIVPAAALDDIVTGPVDLMKADIEGAEYLAFKGGERLIVANRPIVTSEVSFEMLSRVSAISGPDLIRWFTRLGYKAFILNRVTRKAEEVSDIDALAANWGSPVRIEDMAFVPNERTQLLSIL